MDFTFSSLITTLFFTSISVVMLYFLLKSNQYIRLIGIRILIMCMLLNIIKLFIPFEFFFSRSISIKFIWPAIYQFIMRPITINIDKKILLLDILYLLWIIGIIFSLFKLIASYILMSNYLRSFEPMNKSSLYHHINIILKKRRKHIHFRFVTSETFSSPFIFGIFHPYVVVPKALNISDKDLYFVLSHEIAHYYNGDLILKLILSLFTAIYWWNPFVYLLQSQITKILEINVDEIASYKWTDNEKIEYLNCLVNFAKNNLNTMQKKWTLLFKSSSPFTISQRVNIMLDNIINPIRPSVFKTTALLFLSLSLFCIPLFITFEAWDIDSNVATETFSIDEQNSFYINNDGTFDLYIDNKYIITVTEIFDKSIKIIEREHPK